jgi:hypothetical protein
MDKKTYFLAGSALLLFGSTVWLGFAYKTELDKNTDSTPVIDNTVADDWHGYGHGVAVDNPEAIDDSDYVFLHEYFDDLPKEDLSDGERDGLLLMREEEKLAHDVYMALYEKWGQRIFYNIARSEQTHTDTIADLLEKYDIEDPVTDTSLGAFKNEDLASLYETLVEQGSESLLNAYIVGATVEDLDISDLEKLMAETDNEDILAGYQNLTKGSRNHIRAYTRMIERENGTYEAQFISEEEYQDILNGNIEAGITYDAQGNRLY